MIWGIIGFIVIISIMFGVTLHEAFWGIFGVVAVLFGLGWMFLTDSGKKFAMYSLAFLGVGLVVFLCYDGITKKSSSERVYNDDIYSCEHDKWRYEGAKVYTNNYTSYYYDQDKVNAIGNKCAQDAINNKNGRDDWWWVEAGAGIMIVIYAIALPKELQKDNKTQPQKLN